MADYHALIKSQNPDLVAQSSREIAATLLPLGLHPSTTHFYRQSDIPEITELIWILTCDAATGLMNRAHSYKGAAPAIEETGEGAEFAIATGSFSYQNLMAAELFIFNSN